MTKLPVSIIGAGKVGTALGYLLARKGYPISAIASSRLESAQAAARIIGQGQPSLDVAEAARQAQIVFITTPDKAIAQTAQEIAQRGGFSANQAIFHCSGALASSVLQPAQIAGAGTGSLHPIQTFADIQQAIKLLPGSYFGFEGDERAKIVAGQIVGTLEGKLLIINAKDKPLYHAAAVFACNYLVTLAGIGVELMQLAGVTKEDALPSLLPLIKGTVSNLEQVGLPQALTGPIARGDAETVQKHLEIIAARIPDLLPVYEHLARETIKLAEEKGSANPGLLAAIKDILH